MAGSLSRWNAPEGSVLAVPLFCVEVEWTAGTPSFISAEAEMGAADAVLRQPQAARRRSVWKAGVFGFSAFRPNCA
jgi:hypothetical protein